MEITKMKKKKVRPLFIVLAVMMSLPTGIMAQNELFGTKGLDEKPVSMLGRNGDTGNGVDWSGGGMIPQDPTQEAPLGSGVLLFVMAGACYAIIDKERKGETTIRQMSLILTLAVLAFFTQCKKQQNTETIDTGDGFQMVLKASNGRSRTNFGVNGSIAWNTNEKIYVVANRQCVGYVTNGTEGGNMFTGTLNGLTESDTYDFHYYYVGNTQTINTGDNSFTMDFSNQDGTLANLGDFHVGYGSQTGVEVTQGETVNAQASMNSLVAMAYFDINNMAETGEKVFFYGDNINNQLSIAFSTNTPVFSKVNNGWICSGTASTGVYVMLVPNHTDGTEELITNITFVSKRTTGTCNNVFNYGIIGGRFYCNGGETDSPIPVTAASYDKGTLRGLFTFSLSGVPSHFSQGNLQYQASTNTWRFAENQWDYVGTQNTSTGDWGSTVNGSDNENISQTYNGWIDLFGWGTSGVYHYPHANCYQPWSTSAYYNDYYPYNKAAVNLDYSSGKADWGYNAIINGNNQENQWHTLKQPEWSYVFHSRETSSGVLYAKAKVNGVNGVVLLPDDWNNTIYNLNRTNGSSDDFSNNIITLENWENVLEPSGAVFCLCPVIVKRKEYISQGHMDIIGLQPMQMPCKRFDPISTAIWLEQIPHMRMNVVGDSLSDSYVIQNKPRDNTIVFGDELWCVSIGLCPSDPWENLASGRAVFYGHFSS